MEKDFCCPECGELIFSQIKPITGIITVICSNCSMEISAAFKKGELVDKPFVLKGDRK